MLRKGLIVLGILIVLLGVITMVYGAQVRQFFRTVVFDPAEDITDLIDKATTTDSGNGTSTPPDNEKSPTYHEVGPLRIRDGFDISVYAEGVSGPRVAIEDQFGNVLVSAMHSGKIVALSDKDNNGKAEIANIIEGLKKPHGLALDCHEGAVCTLYVAESHQVSAYNYSINGGRAIREKTLVTLPDGGHHTTRSLLIQGTGSDKHLLISVGSSCNVCREEDNRRASILSVNLSTGVSTSYATGLRNAVYIAERPGTDEVWVSEMGRDQLGDDIPPDEINIIKKDGFYGWPICYGKNIHDTQFDKNTYIRNPCTEPFEAPSHIDLQAHSAPLGLGFAPGDWGVFSGDLFVAYHGSWNRSVPTGYKVVRLKLHQNGSYEGVEDFISGWIKPDGAVLGRPAGILFLRNGQLLITDDKANVIYRVSKQ